MFILNYLFHIWPLMSVIIDPLFSFHNSKIASQEPLSHASFKNLRWLFYIYFINAHLLYNQQALQVQAVHLPKLQGQHKWDSSDLNNKYFVNKKPDKKMLFWHLTCSSSVIHSQKYLLEKIEMFYLVFYCCFWRNPWTSP